MEIHEIRKRDKQRDRQSDRQAELYLFICISAVILDSFLKISLLYSNLYTSETYVKMPEMSAK